MIFSNSVIKELKTLSENADTIYTNKDLSICLKQLNKIFDYPNSIQAINEIINSHQISLKRLDFLKISIIKDLNLIESIFIGNSKNLEANYCLETSKQEENKSKDKFPCWQEAGLKVALKYVLKEKIQIKDGFTLLWIDSFIKKEVNEIIQTSSILSWEFEYQNNKNLKQLIDNIKYIKRFKLGISDSDTRKLKVAIQNICNHFFQISNKVTYLETLTIEEISFSYTYNITEKKCFIVIYINNNISIRFDGSRSKHLNELLSNPWITIEEDNSIKNNNLQKELDDVNRQFCKKFYSYGFIYGHAHLFVSDGYSHYVNKEYAHLIKKIS